MNEYHDPTNIKIFDHILITDITDKNKETLINQKSIDINTKYKKQKGEKNAS